METNNKTISYMMLLGGLMIMGTIGILRRFIPISSSLLAFFRGMIGGISLLIFDFAFKRKSLVKAPKKQLALVVLSGFAIGINWLFLFEAFNYTTIAKATLCCYTAPSLVILISPIFLKEKLTAKKLICAAVSLFGMVLVSGVLEGNATSANDEKGIIYALLCAVFYAIVIILNKKIHDVDLYQKTIIQLISAATVLIPYILITEDLASVELSENILGLILVAGVIYTGIAYVLYFGGMIGLPAQTISALSYTDPVVSMICSALILKESISALGILGAVFILGSAIIGEINIKKHKGVTHGQS